MLTCVVVKQTFVWDDNSYYECELIQGEKVRAEQRNNTIVSVEGQLAITLIGNTVLACKIQLQETHEHMYIFIKMTILTNRCLIYLKYYVLLINLTMNF